MKNKQKQEILDYNFPAGISLIEANAGTGKTFSIELLYLKALLELKLEVQQILLVTFTVEATQQIKKRIFDAVQRCYDFFSCQQNNVENFPLQQFLEKIQKEKILSSKEITLLLQKAVVYFDEAAIFSIHSFAARMNSKSFIQTTIGTKSELRESLEKDVAEELFLSFWLARILPNTDYANFCYRILDKKEKNEIIKSFYNLVHKIDFVKIFGNSGPLEFSKNDNALLSERQFLKIQEAVFELKKKWQWNDIEKLLEMTKTSVKKQKPTIQKHFQTIQENLVTVQSVGDETFRLSLARDYFIKWFEELKSFASTKFFLEDNLAASVLQRYILAKNDFFSFLRMDFLNCAKKKFTTYKRERQLYTYDDIISSFHTLSQEQTLKTIKQFKLVIIDEFQDTDEIQSQAFLHLFHYNNQQTRMILVGDPKQSIFRFRGGDIFTYLKMKEYFVNDQSYRLDKNWRSQKEIVEMVNLLFQQPNSFLLDNLEYFPSSAVLKQSEGFFLEKEPQAAFKVWDCEWNAKAYQKGLGQASLENKILMHLAGEISRMIALGQQGKLKIGNKKLEPNMICILVPSNENILKTRQTLSRFGIYASATSKVDLSETVEFLDFWGLLQAIFYYRDTKKIRTCLLSRLFSYSLADLYAAENNHEKWERILEEFRQFHLLWEKKGFALMIEEWMRKKKILKNLLNYGYRAVANFHHSLDFFLKQFQKNNSIAQCKKILETILEKLSQNLSKNNLRVESDTNAVQIMTIHKSKGLEFPIVFCPYLWKPYNPREKPVFFHSEEIENKKTRKKLSYDLSKERLYLPQIEVEQEAENRRLLYVLLTRAKHQIHLYYSEDYAVRKKSPFVELLEQLKKTENFKKWRQCIKKLPINFVPDFKKFSFSKKTLKEPKKWVKQIAAVTENYSFSSLTSQKQSSLLETLKEIYKKTITDEKKFKTISEKDRVFHLPSGVEVGNLVHQVLDFWQYEQKTTHSMDQSNLEKKVKNFIQQQLPFFKIEKFWTDTLFTLCQKSYHHHLQIVDSQTSLLKIPPLHKTGEIKFHLDLKKTELIEKILFLSKKNQQCKVLQSLKGIVLQFTDKEFQNICVGIIDLVFFYKNKYYILDWKTNWLGEKAEDYHSENLYKAMLKHNYFLQYFLYYLAMEKFLIAKNSSFTIGGVFYLFVRGLSAKNLKLGVFFDEMNYMLKSNNKKKNEK